MGQEKTKLCQNEMNYGTEQGHILGQDKLTYIHDENFWDKRSGL
jgi:hypothetical protein